MDIPAPVPKARTVDARGCGVAVII
jgi:hypothetical protein